MLDNIYINIAEWLVAVAAVLSWARFASWIASDVQDLRGQSENLWKSIGLGVLILMLLVWILMPSFWISLPLNFLIVGGAVAAYWAARVKALGPQGSLLSGVLKKAGQISEKHAQKHAAKAMTLKYLRSDETPVPLPPPEDPIHVGLSYSDELVTQALERRAEAIELHPAPGGAAYELRFLIDGIAFPQPPMERNVGESTIQAVKLLAKLTVEERRRPQEGLFKSRDQSGHTTRWTVRTSGTTAGEKLSLNANEQARWTLTLDQLGLNAEQLGAIRQLGQSLEGVVIVASPRQTGRTSTLYSLLRMHDAFTNSVFTLENNPQADIEGVTVTRYDSRAADLAYSKALQSVMLKDPHILMSALCPDAQSAQSLARFAQEDHRVYMGMAAFDTMAALEAWIAMVGDKALAVKSLRAIISQRLIRLLCPTCKIPYQPDEATLRRLNLPVGRNLQSCKANTEGILDDKGHRMTCPDCASIGYRGRTGIFEVLVLTDPMRKDILTGATLKQVQAAARKNNMNLLVEHGIRKFAAGLTSIQEVTRVVTPEKTPQK